ncbi:DUF2470 domain-containing protein, partial [Mesorhizobium sp. M8A.F.Ca.ET.021.01.1.1]|uniref:DUF2470 domain-containing protein n=1 Tax=Mesorhizobium sp. M8A.F.Ca.ET.021.01.1.1 TaxID=2496757 RepID=UPI000FCBE9B1
RADLLTNGPIIEELAGSEQSAVEHMNADHLDAIAIYARDFAKAPGDGWTIAGLDADGMDLVSGDNVCRVFFPQPLVKASELRPALVEMARIGRAASEA